MRRNLFFQAACFALDSLFLASLLLLPYGIVWEYSTRKYLRGFADAIVPLSAPPEQRAEAILAWIKSGPARRTTLDSDAPMPRDPEDTLNYRQLLAICGTATNAFVNLASSSGLPARRLLLLDPNRQVRHVVAEVRLGDRWVVVDPTFRTILRDAQGRPLTRQQLTDPRLFQEATQKIPGFSPEYTFDRTVHVRLGRVPLVGKLLRRALDTVLPGWEERFNWTLVLERESLAVTLLAALLACFSFVGRLALTLGGARWLGIPRVRLRDRLVRASAALFGVGKPLPAPVSPER